MNLHNKSCTHVVTYKVELDKGSIVFLQDVYDNRGRVVHTVLMDADLDPITSRDSPGLLEEVREFVDQWNTEND